MKFDLNAKTDHLFILGAGASADYGLPIWDRLSVLVSEQVNNNKENSLQYKDEILSWMNKIGTGKEYDTIDRCITKESRTREYRSNGLTIENGIYSIMRDIFEDLYIENEDGWVSKLNQKILDSGDLEDRIAFINYNYDKVLDENFLNFDYLTQKERDVDYRTRIRGLSGKYISAFYPHGNFFSADEMRRISHLNRLINTNKSELNNVIDAISCHESKPHSIQKYGYRPTKIYLLGLGNGLKVNLNNLDFNGTISEIHVTIKDPSIKNDDISTFLGKKFSLPATEIKIYSTCDDLIEECLSVNH